jgi:hypothetical protein
MPGSQMVIGESVNERLSTRIVVVSEPGRSARVDCCSAQVPHPPVVRRLLVCGRRASVGPAGAALYGSVGIRRLVTARFSVPRMEIRVRCPGGHNGTRSLLS